MKAVMRWLSRDRLPAYVSSHHKVNLWVREPNDGRIAIAPLNTSFDAANGLEPAVATSADEARVFNMQAEAQVIRSSNTNGPYRRFVLPAVEPWTMRLVVVGAFNSKVK